MTSSFEDIGNILEHKRFRKIIILGVRASALEPQLVKLDSLLKQPTTSRM